MLNNISNKSIINYMEEINNYKINNDELKSTVLCLEY
jgi:hypothetical protein